MSILTVTEGKAMADLNFKIQALGLLATFQDIANFIFMSFALLSDGD